MKTLQIMYGSHIVPFLTRSAYKTTFGRVPGLHFGSILATLGSLWHTLARPGGHMCTFLAHRCAPLFSGAFCIEFGAPGGSQKKSRRHGPSALATWENSIWPLWGGFPLED